MVLILVMYYNPAWQLTELKIRWNTEIKPLETTTEIK